MLNANARSKAKLPMKRHVGDPQRIFSESAGTGNRNEQIRHPLKGVSDSGTREIATKQIRSRCRPIPEERTGANAAFFSSENVATKPGKERGGRSSAAGR